MAALASINDVKGLSPGGDMAMNINLLTHFFAHSPKTRNVTIIWVEKER